MSNTKNDLLDLFASTNSNKNLNYTNLYNFVGANTTIEKKVIRKKIQNLELSHINTTFLKVLIDSKFFADNKDKAKFAYLLPAFEVSSNKDTKKK
jgi:hypothetical protein